MSSATPNSTEIADNVGNQRFRSQAATTEELLKSQTVGLVNLSDFRKRRAEALERKELGRFTSAASDGNPANADSPSDG